MVLKEITKNRDIADHGHFVTGFGHFVLEQSADGQCVSAADQDIGFQRPRVDNRARYRCTCEDKGGISDLVADLGFHLHGDKVVLIDTGGNDKGVAKLLVLESPENGGSSLLIEIQLRNGLCAVDLDLRLQIVGGNNPWVR